MKISAKGKDFFSTGSIIILLIFILILTACGQTTSVNPGSSSIADLTSGPSLPPTISSTQSILNDKNTSPTVSQVTLPAVKAAIGATAPDFSAKDTTTQTVALSALKGRPVLINYWSVYCEPCRQEAPELVKAYEANKGRLSVVGVNMNDTSQDVKNFLAEFKITYPTIIDDTGDLVFKYRVRGRPTSIFINRQGIISDIVLGQLTSEAFEQALNKILSS